MLAWFGSRLRHPFFPEIPATAAQQARGSVAGLSGTLKELEEAAQSGVVVQRAVFVIHHWNELLLTAAEREHIWNLFEVPVYAVLLDGLGNLVAYECEAQNGLHMVAGAAEPAACACGRPGMQPKPGPVEMRRPTPWRQSAPEEETAVPAGRRVIARGA